MMFKSVCCKFIGPLLIAGLWLSCASAQAPISYQGQLEQSGSPYTGTVNMSFVFYASASGGSPLHTVNVNGVSVNSGLFQVELNTAGVDFSQPVYVEPRVSGTPLLPRQRISAAPLALHALNGGGSYQNVIMVATSGGDFSSVADAMNSISAAGPTNRYLVQVGPGVYAESERVSVPAWVHLKGSGPHTTLISSTQSGTSATIGSTAVALADNAAISEIGILNTGTNAQAMGLYLAGASRETLIDNVHVTVSGARSGGGRYGIYLNDAEPTIRNSYFKAYGVTGFGSAVNAALASIGPTSGGLPSPLIESTVLLGGSQSTQLGCTDPSGTGFGVYLTRSGAEIRHSFICAGHRTISQSQNGLAFVAHSELRVGSTTGAYMFEQVGSGAISVAHSTLSYVGNKFTGTGVGLRCAYNVAGGSWAPLSNGTSASTACN